MADDTVIGRLFVPDRIASDVHHRIPGGVEHYPIRSKGLLVSYHVLIAYRVTLENSRVFGILVVTGPLFFDSEVASHYVHLQTGLTFSHWRRI